jgi:hypothetical protein
MTVTPAARAQVDVIRAHGECGDQSQMGREVLYY